MHEAKYTLIIDNFYWSKSSVKIILLHIFSGLNILKTRPFSSHELNQETKVKIYNRTIVPDKPLSRDRF